MAGRKPDIHHVLRQSNRFWQAMYYDGVIDRPAYHISYLRNADRLYYNAAHALKSTDQRVFDDIEADFRNQGIVPGIYWDEQSPDDLTSRLAENEYVMAPAETENWYDYALKEQHHADIALTRPFTIDVFKPEPGRLLDQFVAVNAAVNALPDALAARLKERLLQKHADVDLYLCLASLDGVPAATKALGIIGDDAFTAEAATMPAFRRSGLFLALTHETVNMARDRGCSFMHVNCDAEAFSNQGCQRYGYKKSFIRHYYQKQGG